MAVLNIPEQDFSTKDVVEIKTFLNERGIFFDQWEASVEFSDAADQKTILADTVIISTGASAKWLGLERS